MVRTAQSSQSGGRRTAAHTCRQLQRSGESFAKETTGSGNLARPRGRGRPQPVVIACQNPRRNAALCSAVTPFSARTARIFSGGSSAHPPWVAPRRRRSSANARPALRPASTGCSCILIQVLHPLADISNTPIVRLSSVARHPPAFLLGDPLDDLNERSSGPQKPSGHDHRYPRALALEHSADRRLGGASQSPTQLRRGADDRANPMMLMIHHATVP
jgi:hypothetical protein